MDKRKLIVIEGIVEKLKDLPFEKKAIISRISGGKIGLYSMEFVNRADEPYVELRIAPEDRTYGIIHVSKETKGFFSGYKKQFVLETDVKPFVMHLTGAPNGTEIGEESGGYIGHPRANEIEDRFLSQAPDAKHNVQGSFLRWYEAHPETEPDMHVRVYRSNAELFRLDSKIK